MDLLLRCVWTINISLTDWNFVDKQIVVTITAVLEVIRWVINFESFTFCWEWRFKGFLNSGQSFTFTISHPRRAIWNFIRLENEHLNNCGQFRAVRDINVRVITDQDRENAVDVSLLTPKNLDLQTGNHISYENVNHNVFHLYTMDTMKPTATSVASQRWCDCLINKLFHSDLII